MNGSAPAASVVVPVYNNPDGLRTTLKALETQTEAAFEVIVVDDGSTDGIGKAGALLARHDAWRMLRTENRGAAAARNTGLQSSAGDVVLFVDCRDEPATDWVETFVATCAPDVGIVRSAVRYRYRELGIETSDRAGRCVMPGTFAVRRSVLSAVGGYDEQLAFGENGDLLSRARKYCKRQGLREAAIDRELVVINDPADPGSYDRQRLEAMEWILRRDVDALRGDPRRRERVAAIGAVNALRLGERSRALRLSAVALRSAPRNRRNWLRIGLCIVPGGVARARLGRGETGAPQILGEPANPTGLGPVQLPELGG